MRPVQVRTRSLYEATIVVKAPGLHTGALAALTPKPCFRSFA